MPAGRFQVGSKSIGLALSVKETSFSAEQKCRVRFGLLSYLFGAVILASVINLVAGLAN